MIYKGLEIVEGYDQLRPEESGHIYKKKSEPKWKNFEIRFRSDKKDLALIKIYKGLEIVQGYGQLCTVETRQIYTKKTSLNKGMAVSVQE